MQKGKFNLMLDAAWGSSGKGAASTRLVDIFGVENVSSCNYPNAGHTVRHGDKSWVFKSLPSAVALKQIKEFAPLAWIGPNSGFAIDQFLKECKETGYRFLDVMVHPRAVQVSHRHVEAESPTGAISTEHLSSTMSGSGAAATQKAMRSKDTLMADVIWPHVNSNPVVFTDAVRARMVAGQTFMHEVSQGYALSLNHGTHYPYCTSRDCTAQQGFADFMITPEFMGDVYLNIRSLPIRVGSNYRDGKQTGYSGDFCSDQQELTWEEVAKNAEMPEGEAAALAERERTTVTKKIRRVATQSYQLIHEAAKLNGARYLVYNFPQYIHWSANGVRGGEEAFLGLHEKVKAEIDKIEQVTGLKVVMIGTGAQHEEYIWRGL